MALTAADLFGVVAYADVLNLDRAVEEGSKATGAGSAISIGRVVAINESTGNWALGTSGNDTRLGVIPKLYPGKDVNTDSSAKITVLTGPQAEVYVEASGAIKPNSRVVAGNGGTVKAWTSGNWLGVYKGHYGEGSGHDQPPTDAANGEAIRIALNTR